MSVQGETENIVVPVACIQMLYIAVRIGYLRDRYISPGEAIAFAIAAQLDEAGRIGRKWPSMICQEIRLDAAESADQKESDQDEEAYRPISRSMSRSYHG